jgi:hypothetical protein
MTDPVRPVIRAMVPKHPNGRAPEVARCAELQQATFASTEAMTAFPDHKTIPL